jgi:hypothetical protein
MNMIPTIIASVLGGAVLVGGAWLAVERKNQPPPVDTAEIIHATMAQYKPAENLTQPDLISVACSAEHIAAHGDLLCRELFCSMTTRGIESKTSGVECEAIRNVSNKKTIIELCSKQPDPAKCYEFFDRRI